MHYFAPVQVNDALTLDFSNSDHIASYHYAFKVSEAEFDAIFARIQAEGLVYGSGPYSQEDLKINHRGCGRGVYFCDPSGHVLELLTVEYRKDDYVRLHASLSPHAHRQESRRLAVAIRTCFCY